MPASAATWGMAFKGQAIVSATLQDLVANRGLDESAEVVFGGCSAGGRGAMVLLDYVSPQLPTNNVRGLLDSGLWIDIPPMDTEEVSLQSQAQQGYALWNPSAVIPNACAKQYSGSDAWKCIYGVYRLPFVTTPYFGTLLRGTGRRASTPPMLPLTLAALHSERGAVRRFSDAL